MILVVNGSNTRARNYLPYFDRLASWGFVVAGTDDASTGDGKSTAATLDYLLNLPADHLLAEKINRDQIGLAGYSQGGAGALRAATQFSNAGVYKAIFTGSAAYPLLATNMGWSYDLTKLRAPIFMTAGTEKKQRRCLLCF